MAGASGAVDLADLPAEVTVSGSQVLAEGFRSFERISYVLPGIDGSASTTCERDILRVGKVVAVLPFDPARDEIVVLRQFRLAAHLANGKGELVEIVAGHVERGEQPVDAASRETNEEIGIEPASLIRLLSYFPSPGIGQEEITLYLGIIDAATLPARAGLASEKEVTLPILVSIDAALAALESGTIHNGPLIIALQWLALHRSRLPEIIRTGG